MSTEASFEKTDELWVIHLAEQEARRLTRIPGPRPQNLTHASHFTVGSGHVVWWTSYVVDDRVYTDIWKVSVTGGEPTLVVTLPVAFEQTNFDGDRLAVANGSVYWSRASSKKGEHAVWRVPLTGGEPSKVPGTEGHYIISLPWVAKPGVAEETGCRPGQQVCTYDTTTLNLYTDLLNIDTGERRSADTSDMAGAVCGVTYCFQIGESWGSGRSSTMVRNRDGSGARVLPGAMGAGASGPGGLLPGLDRFVVLATANGYLLYDLRAGRHAPLGQVSGSSAPGTWLPENRLLHWPVDGGEAYVVDLAAIK